MSSEDEMGPGWSGAVWQVQVFIGRPLATDKAKAPLVFTTPTIAVGGDSPLTVDEPIAYGPVMLFGEAGSLSIMVPTEMTRAEYERRLDENWSVGIGFEDVRSMVNVAFEFDHWGTIRAEGWELDGEGRPVRGVWEIEPFQCEAQDDGTPQDENG